jgi:hypothetical protein
MAEKIRNVVVGKIAVGYLGNLKGLSVGFAQFDESILNKFEKLHLCVMFKQLH